MFPSRGPGFGRDGPAQRGCALPRARRNGIRAAAMAWQRRAGCAKSRKGMGRRDGLMTTQRFDGQAHHCTRRQAAGIHPAAPPA
jgi:hypothetical protein